MTSGVGSTDTFCVAAVFHAEGAVSSNRLTARTDNVIVLPAVSAARLAGSWNVPLVIPEPYACVPFSFGSHCPCPF